MIPKPNPRDTNEVGCRGFPHTQILLTRKGTRGQKNRKRQKPPEGISGLQLCGEKTEQVWQCNCLTSSFLPPSKSCGISLNPSMSMTTPLCLTYNTKAGAEKVPEQHNARRHFPACQWKGVSLIGNYVNVARWEHTWHWAKVLVQRVWMASLLLLPVCGTLPVCLPSTVVIILTCALLTCPSWSDPPLSGPKVTVSKAILVHECIFGDHLIW